MGSHEANRRRRKGFQGGVLARNQSGERALRDRAGWGGSMSAQEHQPQRSEESAGEEASGLIVLLQGLIEAARAMIAHSRALLSQLEQPRKPPLQ